MFSNFKQYPVLLTLILALGTACQAGPIVGSLPMIGLGFTQTSGTNVGDSNGVFTSTGTLTSNTGTGDLAPIPAMVDFGPQTIDLNDLLSFSLANANWGSFTTSSGLVVQQNANFLDLFLTGTFTPGPSLLAAIPGLDPTAASLRISLNQSGTSISEALTLNAPPTDTPHAPEPATMFLAGSALLGVGLWGRRRRAKS